jgi:hypothetical protein
MKRLIIGLVVVLAVSIWMIGQAQSGQRKPRPPQNLQLSLQFSTACSLCFTCGGAWPVFSGEIHEEEGASTVERGPNCAGGFEERDDDIPWLCCKSLPSLLQR